MINDAETNAESDRQKVKLVTSRNSSESIVHQMRKDLEEHGDKITAEEKTKLEDALTGLESVMAGEDCDAMTAAQTAVFEAAGPLFTAQTQQESTESQKDNVVDAEFTEVKS